jgi:uncharacterized protein (TIGR03545 family)
MMADFLRRHRVMVRLGLLAALILLAQWGVGQYVKWSVIQSAQDIVGASVEVGSSRVSSLNGRFSLHDVRVANPHAPLRNLLEAQDCQFSLDPEALLYRRAVVQQGHVRGLRFATPRADGAIGDSNAEADNGPWSDWLSSASAQQARLWLDQLEDHLQEDLSDQLQSVRLTDQLLAQWPTQYDALEKRVRLFHQRTVELQSQIHDAQANPLRHVDFLEHLPDTLAALRSEYQKLQLEVDGLPDLADADRRAIVAARRHDEKLLFDKLRFEPIDDNVLSAYLLQRQFAGPVSDLVGCLQWMRQIVPADPQSAPPAHRRGEDVLFAGCRRAPQLLIRSLDLQGAVCCGNQTFEFTGKLTDYASDPTLHDRPLHVQLKSDGSASLDMRATVDRTGPVARDELSLDCRNIPVPAALLGESDKLRLSLVPTTASLVVHVVVAGNELSGDLQFTQDHAEVTPRVGGELKRLPIAASLEKPLHGIDSVKTRVVLRGTLAEPHWQISSNLGPALAKATRDAFGQAARQHAAQVVAKSQQDVDERLAGLDRQIARQQEALKPQMAQSTGLLDEITQQQAQEGRISYERLGDRPPAGSLFR